MVVDLLFDCCYEPLPLYFQPHVQVLEVRFYQLNFSREQLCSLDVDLTPEQETIPVGSLHLMPKLGLLLVVLVLVLFLGVVVGVGREGRLDGGSYFVDGVEPHLAVQDSEVMSVPGVPLLQQLVEGGEGLSSEAVVDGLVAHIATHLYLHPFKYYHSHSKIANPTGLNRTDK